MRQGWTVFVLLLLAGPAYAVEQQGAEQAESPDLPSQRFVLDPGWNLITFQVLPTGGETSDVFSRMVAADGSGARLFDAQDPRRSTLQAAFAVDSLSDTRCSWRAFEAVSYTDPGALPPGRPFPGLPASATVCVGQVHEKADAPLSRVRFGAAYLILVEGIPPGTAFEIAGEESAAGMPTRLATGWNLIGFPFDVTAPSGTEPDFDSLFRQEQLDRIERIVGWESAEAEYRSYVPSGSDVSRLRKTDPGMGYWIHAVDGVVLEPQLIVVGPADPDPPPPGTQSWLRVRRSDVERFFELRNGGGGAMGWTAQVQPYSGDAPACCVALDSTAAVDDVFSLSARQGQLFRRPQELVLSVNRRHLLPATYLADLVIRSATDDERRFTLAVAAGGLEGQWRGFVTIDTVNGRRNAVADIDVHLHISADALDGSRLLRGFIDSREALLWPSDAPFVGQILEPRSPRWSRNYRGRFVLAGDLTLPPGDRNRFPFDRFPHPDDDEEDGAPEETDSVTGLPYRTNQDGDRLYYTLPGRGLRPDFTNRTQAFISRHFQFLGAETAMDGGFHPLAPFSRPPSMDDGRVQVIRGRYVETVTGLLNEPIRMKGRFRLERVSFVPYERRPLRQFHDVRRGERSGDERVDARIEVGAEDDLLIHRAIVVVAQTAPGETHRLTLTAPDGQVIVLHDRERIDGTGNVIFDSSEDPLGVVSLLDPPVVPGVGPLPASGSQFEAALRESVGTYVVRRPRESLRALRGRPGSGTWTLSWIDFNEGRTADFNGWSLQLFGTPIARVAGEVVFASGSPDASFHDVKLDVVGTPVSVDERLIAFDRVTGRFEIRYLPGVRVDVLASKPGYAQAGISGLDAFDHPRGFVDGLAGFLAGGPGTDRLSIILRPTAEDVAPVVTAVPGHGESNPSLVRPVYGAALAGFGSMCARQTAIHAAIGGQIASLGVPATDGENRVWVGATPAPDSTNPRRNEECE